MDAILLDLDGTLLDTGPDLAVAVNAARRAFGLSALAVEEVTPHLGWGLTRLLTGTLPEGLHPRLPEAREHFHAVYGERCLVDSVPYPSVSEFLADPPCTLALVTNKPGRHTRIIVEGLGWDFAAVVAGDALAKRKPEPEPLLHCLELLGVAPGEAVFVGDSEVDQEAALRAGVPFAAVAWGRVAPSAEWVIDSLEALR